MSPRPSRQIVGALPAGVPLSPRYRGAVPALAGMRPPYVQRRAGLDAGRLIDSMVTALMVLAVAATFMVSAAVLTHFNVHYVTAGGVILEKFHPTTYLTFFAFCLLMVRHGDPFAELNRVFDGSLLFPFYLMCWTFLLIQTFVLNRPFTVIIDTFLLPLLLCLVFWRMTPEQKRPVVWALHLTVLLNICIGYYEYFTGHRLIPLTLGDVLVVGEWRSSALLGHPLTASGLVGAYILALILRPSLCPPAIVRVPLIAFSLGSLMAFGGRTALVTVLLVIVARGLVEVFRLLRGGRTSLPMVIGVIGLAFVAGAVVVAALNFGIFDKMLLRFSSDKGSTLARFATFSFLSYFDWSELLLGPNPARVNALQSQLGLNYGIENFWISCVAQFGIIHTVLLTLGLIALFVEIVKRSGREVWAVIFLILNIAASSVSFSSKNIQLAQFIILITLLLPRLPPPGVRHGAYRQQLGSLPVQK